MHSHCPTHCALLLLLYEMKKERNGAPLTEAELISKVRELEGKGIAIYPARWSPLEERIERDLRFLRWRRDISRYTNSEIALADGGWMFVIHTDPSVLLRGYQ
jgi:hypothetical protein